MSKNWITAAALSCLLTTGVGFVIAEDEDKPVAKKDVPEAVLKTATLFSEGGELDKCVLADEDGLEIYELHMKKGDRKIEVQTTTSGELFATEEKVGAEAVPELVKQRAAKLFTKGEKVKYERAIVVLYEVAAKDDKGHEVEYLVNQAGAAYQEIAGGIGEDKGKEERGRKDEKGAK